MTTVNETTKHLKDQQYEVSIPIRNPPAYASKQQNSSPAESKLPEKKIFEEWRLIQRLQEFYKTW